mmetsp:Transcript_17142/g.15119  ORF Transcript_17142/g.15119 Transcript_17142/m.15119 type:complete len:81 (-) Transcript_17142:747-989(-)
MKNKLMSTFSTQEVVGEWNLNFLYSKAAQYEALTDIKIIYFERIDYEKVMVEAKTKYFNEGILKIFRNKGIKSKDIQRYK